MNKTNVFLKTIGATLIASMLISCNQSSELDTSNVVAEKNADSTKMLTAPSVVQADIDAAAELQRAIYTNTLARSIELAPQALVVETPTDQALRTGDARSITNVAEFNTYIDSYITTLEAAKTTRINSLWSGIVNHRYEPGQSSQFITPTNIELAQPYIVVMQVLN